MSYGDIYPNDGANYDETRPNDQELELRAEEAKVHQSYPILDELIAEREEQLKDADTISSLAITSAMPTLQAQIIIEGNSRFITLLKSDLERLKDFKDRYKQGSLYLGRDPTRGQDRAYPTLALVQRNGRKL